MSGISPIHPNKFKTCLGCEHRTIEPVNCHDVCKGYLYRQQRYKEIRIKKSIESYASRKRRYRND